MSKQSVVIVFVVAAAILFVVAVVIGALIFIAPLFSSRLVMPSALKIPRVLVGEGFLSKSVFLQSSQLRRVGDIREGELDAAAGPEIGVAGSLGALFVDRTGTVKASVIFKGKTEHVDMIDVEGDGVCEFMNRGSWGCDASLIDHQGTTIWDYGGTPGVDDMAAGDVDGDGVADFVVGFNGDGGVHLLDKKGQKRWQQPDGNVWHVEVVDVDNDGKPEIVHSNAAGQLTVRDGTGLVLRKSALTAYFSDFSLCPWPSKTSPYHALSAEDDTIWLYDFNGKTIAQFSAPECGSLGHARGTIAKLKAGQADFFCVLVEYDNWNRSLFYVYDAPGKLVYQEVLPQACGAIYSIRFESSETDTILIGGDSTVWEFN